jgi:predicted RNA-binding protein YlxR (DUF448 family)
LPKFKFWPWLTETYRPRALAFWASISVMVALAGPFGTYAEMTVPERLPYWSGVFGAAILLAQLCRRACRPWLVGLWLWTRGVIVSAIFASVFAPMVQIFHEDVVPGPAARAVPVATLWLVWFLSSLVESAIWTLMQGEPEAEAPAEPELPRLLTRLAPELQGELRSLSVRDHYVVVTTNRGQGNLLLRFADALDELGETEGLRVHRSHWVAASAMQRIEREASRLFLRLTDGRQVPVSRSYRDAVLKLGLPVIDRSGTAAGGAPSSTARAPEPIRARSVGSVQDSPPV